MTGWEEVLASYPQPLGSVLRGERYWYEGGTNVTVDATPQEDFVFLQVRDSEWRW